MTGIRLVVFTNLDVGGKESDMLCSLHSIAKEKIANHPPDPLINNKWPPRVDPGGHHFVVLDTSINKKPFFFSQVVIYKKIAQAASAPASGQGALSFVLRSMSGTEDIPK